MAMDAPVPQSIGWHGKLPSRGDFVGRGMPRAWLRVWDDWLQRGLASAAQRWGPALREHVLAMAPWQCVVLPQQPGQPVWCGVVAASTDRVGRAYPLLLAEAYDEASLLGVGLADLQARALQLWRGLDEARSAPSPRDFEGRAARLAGTPWSGTAHDAAPEASLATLREHWPQAGSFWWRIEPASDLDDPWAEPWPPSHALMLALLGQRD